MNNKIKPNSFTVRFNSQDYKDYKDYKYIKKTYFSNIRPTPGLICLTLLILIWNMYKND